LKTPSYYRNRLVIQLGWSTFRARRRHGSPLLDLNLPNFIVTPHVAWASNEAVQALANQVIDNIEAFIAGTPRNVLT
jgi:lactate dehydrogenase-like 2-hydroxyacid dehydrogenase